MPMNFSDAARRGVGTPAVGDGFPNPDVFDGFHLYPGETVINQAKHNGQRRQQLPRLWK
ncbi:Uu.00g077660.m01.CDS01 [Anthostomella pinea]|uniref:Uu.00g077660.m01.CDS01 n=1 Tax=Anthostomella pinea TaxID=933095 RepID=A0AAI8YPG7_9PEZI|nr:Uu.00g077660.m01.CDS01 [Anthostomella pinea]